MKLHIFTLNWNGADKLEVLQPGLFNNLECLFTGTEYIDNEWYIRDNGSKDGSIALIDKWNNYAHDYSIKKFDIGHNRDNFSQGMNFLFDEANPADDDLILLLNNDVQFDDSVSLLNMYNLMQETNVGIVGARLVYPGVNKLQHAGVIFSKRYNNMPYHYKHQQDIDSDSRKNRYFQAVTAAVCLIKVSVFRKLNGFYLYFFWELENIDFCLRTGEIREKIDYCGGTNILHEESASLKKNPVNKLFLNNNVLRFKQKWNGKYKTDHDLYLNDPDYNIIK